MEQEGVKFICNANVGDNVEPQIFLKEFDATVICTGATQPRDLPIEGRKLSGVHFAMEYLTANTKALLDGGAEHGPIQAGGKDVVVIGGGDTGTDCVGTAHAQGCRSLVQIEILPRPPAERAADNPWPEWPKTYKLDYGQEEAAARFGADPRVYQTTVKEFVGDEAGNVKELVTVESSGRGTRRASSSRRRSRAPRRCSPRSCAAGDGIPRARAGAPQGDRRRAATRAATSRPSTRSTRPASRASSPRATAAAGRAWSSGRSTRAAAPRASATAT